MEDATTPKILIVDDEEDLCQYLKLMLSKKANYEVDFATNGEMALDKLKSSPFNVVVSDINMPRMDGIALLNNIKAYDPDIEVIMLTGKSSLETAVQALQYKAYDYIEKPVESRRLLIAIGNALGKQKLNTELKSLLDKVSDERKALKQQLDSQSSEMIRKERLATIGAISSLVTGEMQGPIHEAYDTAAALAADSNLGEDASQKASSITEKIGKVKGMLDDIVQYCTTVKPTVQAFTANQNLQPVIDRFVSIYPHVQFSLKADIGPMDLSYDAEQFSRALSTILENACDALEGKGEVTVTASYGDGYLTVSVTDNGPGISEGDLNKVLMPFFTTKGKDGTGMGLSIVKRIMDDHQGRVRVESKAGSGATFFLDLPAE